MLKLMLPYISVDRLVEEFISGGAWFGVVLCGPLQYLHHVKLLVPRRQLFGRVLVGRTGPQGCIQLEQHLYEQHVVVMGIYRGQKVRKSKGLGGHGHTHIYR